MYSRITPIDMTIRSKLILNYSVLSFILLLLFSGIVTALFISYRQQDFQTRLYNRAASSVNMLFVEKSIDSGMLRLIDKNIITSMSDFRLVIYDEENKVVYTNLDNRNEVKKGIGIDSNRSFPEYLAKGRMAIEYDYGSGGRSYRVIAAATDSQSRSEFMSLLHIQLWVVFFSLLIIAGFAFYNATWSLRPFKKIVQEVDAIEPSELKRRLTVSGSDELSQLSQTFNKLLDRIAQAFEMEKSFIANASHELRTPVTSVLGQIEVILNKDRTGEEYRAILQSVYEDTGQMANIINGFLDLAEANLAYKNIEMEPVGIDELLFAVVDDFEKRKPNYGISVEFLRNPDSDNQIQCLGNARLLQLLFSNLIDNACKYSSEKKAKVKIDFNEKEIMVSVTDYGIGIPGQDLNNIFKPMYRAGNVVGEPGHGIGLAIVQRIATLHHANVGIESELNIGTTVTVRLNTFKA